MGSWGSHEGRVLDQSEQVGLQGVRGGVWVRPRWQCLSPGLGLCLQGGWDHISVRANATRAPRSETQDTTREPSGVPSGDPKEAMGPVCC